MTTRRAFLAGLAAFGTAPAPSWADLGNPAWVSAAKTADGSYAVVGVDASGRIAFQQPLPDRGHDTVLHPKLPHVVGFARRPGRFARILDCRTGASLAMLDAPAGRHFYGHGVFTRDGAYLFTTENDFETATGMIGVWDARESYKRIGEFPSGGTGPHDIALLPDRDVLVIANGGIETHPDSGRTKLNIPMMRPNLSYLDLTGVVIDQIELDRSLHKNSIRHLDVDGAGHVAFAMQWEGASSALPPLLGWHRLGQDPVLLSAPDDIQRDMQNYAGSTALSGDASRVAITSPRGGKIHVFDWANRSYIADYDMQDVCGVAAHKDGFTLTTGTGEIATLTKDGLINPTMTPFSWDNHAVSLPDLTSTYRT